VLGGWLTDAYSGRWVFYSIFPSGILSIVMVQMFVFDPSYIKRSKAGIDYWGIGMLAVWVGALQIVFDKGQELDWFGSRSLTSLLAVCGCSLIAFLVREFTARPPRGEPARLQASQLLDRRVSHDRAGVCAVRQHRDSFPSGCKRCWAMPAMTTGLDNGRRAGWARARHAHHRH